ncbi:hypothetical protein FE257_007665 [Aspergillus nanangensis]|uniref:RRM domain-containing protein n=1 Tax=Aspergillus nanangensis TaxID=2582783 RepID=A0AAD4CMF6_ASPNN|nr:hypothetical protein FE257_007665 [Aspergillus nanangensis]
MTPSPPDEALHFRGKTLTPESPRPLHIAEPANIPVLQNQMDPVFNDTSTYNTSELAFGVGTHVQHNAYLAREDRYLQSGERRGDSSFMKGADQPPPPPPQYQHAQGSFHSLQTDNAWSNNATMFSMAVAAPIAPPPSEPSGLAMVTATTFIQAPDANFSLTIVPPPDPAPFLAHPVPEVPSSSSSHAAQNIPIASEVDHAVTSWASPSAPQDRPDAQSKLGHNTGNDGVNFQNLLDNLPPPSTAGPSALAVSETAPSADAFPQAATDDALQTSLGLPPRPPPQEKPSIHPNYQPNDDIRAYHQIPPQTPNTPTSYSAQQSNNYQPGLGLSTLAAAGAPGTSSGANSLPPPPGLSFQNSPPAAPESRDSSPPGAHKIGRGDRPAGRPAKGSDDDAPWGPEVQKKYDEFLHDERVYVTEGLWDRFPPGSRLFVGNLPTERVTKRDLFHIFHKYGKLAQISIKQAYGFIQFLEAPACKQALDVEQSTSIRGRKTLRSRSLNVIHDRVRRLQSPLALLPQDAQDHQNLVEAVLLTLAIPELLAIAMTGPTNLDGFLLVTIEMIPILDGEMIIGLLPRGRHRPVHSEEEMGTALGTGPLNDTIVENDDVPDPHIQGKEDIVVRALGPGPSMPMQISLSLGETRAMCQKSRYSSWKKNFIFHVENSFRNRGLRVDVLVLGPRIPLNAAVQRQIIEGVLAVVRLARPNQFSRKIPLQVFDRTGGPDNVRFNEYPDVDPSIAAEIVLHATQALQRGVPPTPFPPNPTFGVPPLGPAPIPQASLPTLTNPPNIANLISTLDGPTLQSVLATLQQRQPAVPTTQPPFPAAATPHGAADLASLLSVATRQPVSGNLQQPLPPQPFPIQAPNAPIVSDPNLIALLAKGLGGQPPQNQAAVNSHVQNIMNQLGKWKP